MTDVTPSAPAVTILIAEDSPAQAKLLIFILEQQGYRVVHAADGRLALEAARRERPALIISDILMPQMDGYQLSAAVKADAGLKDVPVILVTSLADPDEVIRGLECGADNFILKPYEEEFLTERVRSALLDRDTLQPDRPGMATEFVFNGQRRLITTRRAQILNVLISIYDDAMRRNRNLATAQLELRTINKSAAEANYRLQREISERDTVEQALRASEARLHELNANLENLVAGRTEELREATRRHLTLLGNLQGMAYRRGNDSKRTLEFISEGCRVLLGRSPEELTGGGMRYGSLIHPDDLERVRRKSRENLAARVPSECEYRVRHADGTYRWVWEKSQGIYSEAGEVVGIEGFITDVTERLKLAEQLREAQRMDAIGRLTGGLAHDLNNYLAVIIGNLDLLAERPSADPEMPKLVEGAISGALRGAELTRSLLAFSRRQPLDPKITDVGKRADEVVKLLKRTIGEKIVVEFDASLDLWPVEIDGAQLDSCIVNLANNARDAMPGGGRLSIAIRNVPAGKGDALSGDHILIELADTGAGMSVDTVSQAFEPFFTTKDAGHGTGLGLSMVHGFVHQSGGVIRIESAIGKGTTVRIYLPRVALSAGVSAQLAKAPQPVGGGETILVVEDNDHVRPTAVGQLVALGYKVVAAESGDAAFALLERGGEPIDLVFTDLVMPGKIDGYELASLVLKRWPAKKVLLTSGFSDNAADALDKQAPVLAILRKPYRKADLARAIRTALSG